MESRIFVPALVFTMKYFFDIEKEITQQLLFTCHLRLIDCKEVVVSVMQVLTAHR
jgi:hypothetical protein